MRPPYDSLPRGYHLATEPDQNSLGEYLASPANRTTTLPLPPAS
jgi:hypothetical protein